MGADQYLICEVLPLKPREMSKLWGRKLLDLSVRKLCKSGNHYLIEQLESCDSQLMFDAQEYDPLEAITRTIP